MSPQEEKIGQLNFISFSWAKMPHYLFMKQLSRRICKRRPSMMATVLCARLCMSLRCVHIPISNDLMQLSRICELSTLC